MGFGYCSQQSATMMVGLSGLLGWWLQKAWEVDRLERDLGVVREALHEDEVEIFVLGLERRQLHLEVFVPHHHVTLFVFEGLET